jgi:pimeloyl-ACP methyl ester carboxylesterase
MVSRCTTRFHSVGRSLLKQDQRSADDRHRRAPTALKVQRPDFVGYSGGGIVTLRTAIRHPNLVCQLVVATAFYTNDGNTRGQRASQGCLTRALPAESEGDDTSVAPEPKHRPMLVATDRKQEAFLDASLGRTRFGQRAGGGSMTGKATIIRPIRPRDLQPQKGSER